MFYSLVYLEITPKCHYNMNRHYLTDQSDLTDSDCCHPERSEESAVWFIKNAKQIFRCAPDKPGLKAGWKPAPQFSLPKLIGF